MRRVLFIFTAVVILGSAVTGCVRDAAKLTECLIRDNTSRPCH